MATRVEALSAQRTGASRWVAGAHGAVVSAWVLLFITHELARGLFARFGVAAP